MPFYIKPFIRFGQLFTRSAEDCAEYMFEALVSDNDNNQILQPVRRRGGEAADR